MNKSVQAFRTVSSHPPLLRYCEHALQLRLSLQTYGVYKKHSLRWLRRRRRLDYRAASAAPVYSEQWSIYDHPELYDAAFAFRDYSEEVNFLEKVFERHNGREAHSFLELGCGVANHAVKLAKRGHRVYALDNSRAQLQYAEDKADKEGANVHFLRDDMRSFQLPDDNTVDLAMLLLGTLSHLQTHLEVQSCWKATLQALEPGGLLIVEVNHPEDLFNGDFVRGDMWEAPLGSEYEVIIEFGTDDDLFDVETQLLRKRVGLSVRKGEAIDLQGEGYVMQRMYTLQELVLLAESVGFEVAGTYGDLSLDIDLAHQQASRLVLVLQKPSEGHEDEFAD